MQADSTAFALLNQTIATFNGDVQVVSPLDGLMLIDNWLVALGSDTISAEAGSVPASLHALKQELQRGVPDGDHIVSLLHDLADQSRQVVDTADDHAKPGLRQLAESLTDFARHLAGEAPANTGGNAPGGPTIGPATV